MVSYNNLLNDYNSKMDDLSPKEAENLINCWLENIMMRMMWMIWMRFNVWMRRSIEQLGC